MEMPNEERRQSKRVVFTVEDGVVGVFNPTCNGGEPVTANVVDISSGGVKLLFKPILGNKIKQGDRLVLSEIRGSSSSQVIINIDSEVKWITEDELSDNIGLGVEFLDVLEEEREHINEMVEFWYLQKI
ncbi:MAG: PilZ domain-containing protein [Calditrichia bacterium]